MTTSASSQKDKRFSADSSPTVIIFLKVAFHDLHSHAIFPFSTCQCVF